MGKLHDRRGRHDRFYRRAKKEQFAARAIYKLEEIDRRVSLFRHGQRVLDLGCRPGSWLQYAAQRVGPGGRVIGVDRAPLDIALPANVEVHVGDVLEIDLDTLNAPGGFDVVLSDMAPDTTGVPFADQARSMELFCRALDLSLELGAPGCAFVGKIFMGDGFDEAVRRVKAHYTRTKTMRPDATRKGSTELYLVALQRKS